MQWAEAWNHHTIALRGERQRSPKDMFIFGMIEEGPRGLSYLKEPVDEELDDFSSYGVDWTEIDNSRILNHHDEQNRPDAAAGVSSNPFLTHQPEHPTEIIVPEANCPLTAEQLNYLEGQLSTLPYFGDESMDARRLLWVTALELCVEMFNVDDPDAE